MQAHQILVNWAEAQATSINRLTGTAWNVAHVGLNDIDAKSSYESTLFFYLVGGQQVYGWKSWDLSSLTQKWVSGTATNYGVVLWATNETTDGKDLRFYSSEAVAPNDVNRPYLEVIYSQQAKTVYFLKDHLGSIRATVQNTVGAPVRGYDDYDPWGFILAGRSLASSILPTTTRNKFTEKEWDDEFGLNWNYFGARYYDPQIGRWMVRDPLAEKYADVTPYQYTHNNPINRFDLDGKADFGSAEKLKAAGMKILTDDDLKPVFDEGGNLEKSYCNVGTSNILVEGNDETLKGMSANAIFDYLSNEKNATVLSYEDATQYANEGVTVILASKEATGSGHVAVVAPGEMVKSGKSWDGKMVPLVFNVGKRMSCLVQTMVLARKTNPLHSS